MSWHEREGSGGLEGARRRRGVPAGVHGSPVLPSGKGEDDRLRDGLGRTRPSPLAQGKSVLSLFLFSSFYFL